MAMQTIGSSSTTRMRVMICPGGASPDARPANQSPLPQFHKKSTTLSALRRVYRDHATCGTRDRAARWSPGSIYTLKASVYSSARNGGRVAEKTTDALPRPAAEPDVLDPAPAEPFAAGTAG